MDYRNEFGGYSGYESFDASFREQVPECKNVKLLSAYDLYISTVLPLEHKKVRCVCFVMYPQRKEVLFKRAAAIDVTGHETSATLSVIFCFVCKKQGKKQ